MKRLVKLVLPILTVIILIACGSKNKEVMDIKMVYPDGLPAIGISKLIDDNKKLDNININYEMQKTTDTLLAELVKGESDLIVVPSNLALKSVEKGLPYKLGGTIGWGSLYLITSEPINDISELKGMEIYNTAKGLTPDIVVRNILMEKGFSENDMNFSYVNAASELAPILVSGKAKAAIVPEPVLSTILDKTDKFNRVFSLNDEWANKYGNELGYPQSTLLIKDDVFNQLNEDKRLDVLLNKFKESIDWVKSNPEDAGILCEELGISVNKDILPEAIANAKLNFVPYDKEQSAYKIYFDAIDNNNIDYSKLFNE